MSLRPLNPAGLCHYDLSIQHDYVIMTSQSSRIMCHYDLSIQHDYVITTPLNPVGLCVITTSQSSRIICHYNRSILQDYTSLRPLNPAGLYVQCWFALIVCNLALQVTLLSCILLVVMVRPRKTNISFTSSCQDMFKKERKVSELLT